MYMPKLNAVAMVVLALGVIAGTGFLVLHQSPTAPPEQAEARKFLRNLSDRDPDVRHEAEAGLRALGPKAIEPLLEAVKSSDPALAERVRNLLAELQPVAAPSAPPRVEVAAPNPGARVDIMEFVLESRGGNARAVDLAGLWVQFSNHGPAPVLVAHALALDHPKMAVFEVEDEKGRASEVPAEVLHLKPADLPEVLAVRPRDSALLFQGGKRLVEAVSKPGTYRIRFAYDATEGSDYRQGVRASSEGVLLPPVRLVSNTLTVTVTE